jgi:hypothetical protein
MLASSRLEVFTYIKILDVNWEILSVVFRTIICHDSFEGAERGKNKMKILVAPLFDSLQDLP